MNEGLHVTIADMMITLLVAESVRDSLVWQVAGVQFLAATCELEAHNKVSSTPNIVQENLNL